MSGRHPLGNAALPRLRLALAVASAWLVVCGALVAAGVWGSSAAGSSNGAGATPSLSAALAVSGDGRGLPSRSGSGSGSLSTPGPPLAAPASPVALARQLARAEATVRDPTAGGTRLVTAGRLEQLDYRALVAHPAEVPEVLARLPAGLRPVAGTMVEAGTELDGLTSASPAAVSLPGWRIVAPPPLAQLVADYHAAGRATGVPWPYLAAINLVESDMGRIQGTSGAGAEGPMQFLPATWAIYGAGGNIDSPRDAIWAAARFLAAYGAPADMSAALSHYNPDDRYVRAVSDYAAVIGQDPLALRGLYQWRVFYRTAVGDVMLPQGYGG